METRHLSIIAAVQVGAVVAGTLITTFILKTGGYGTSAAYLMRFNPRSVWIREYGLVLLLLPVIWFGYALWNKFRTEDQNRFSTAIGFILLLGLVILYIDTIANPYVRRLIMIQ